MNGADVVTLPDLMGDFFGWWTTDRVTAAGTVVITIAAVVIGIAEAYRARLARRGSQAQEAEQRLAEGYHIARQIKARLDGDELEFTNDSDFPLDYLRVVWYGF